jgi:hypothetical protein
MQGHLSCIPPTPCFFLSPMCALFLCFFFPFSFLLPCPPYSLPLPLDACPVDPVPGCLCWFNKKVSIHRQSGQYRPIPFLPSLGIHSLCFLPKDQARPRVFHAPGRWCWWCAPRTSLLLSISEDRLVHSRLLFVVLLAAAALAFEAPSLAALDAFVQKRHPPDLSFHVHWLGRLFRSLSFLSSAIMWPFSGKIFRVTTKTLVPGELLNLSILILFVLSLFGVDQPAAP